MPYLVALARADVDDPAVRAFAESIGRQGTKADRAHRILRAVSARIRYEPDTTPDDAEPTERIRAPHVVLARGAGDCDCMAGLILCVALILGLEGRLAVVASRDPARPHHVWIDLQTEAGWKAVDPVLQPPELGRHLDGRIILWDSHGREVEDMRVPIVQPTAPILVSPGLGAPPVFTPGRMDGLGSVDGLGFPGAAEAANLALPWIKKGLAAIANWITGGGPYDAYRDFVNRVAETDANTTPGATNEETIANCLAVGIVPIYCSDSEGTRNNLMREFAARGWQNKGWGQSYSIGWGQKTWWFGLILKTADAPAALVQRAQQRAIPDMDSAWRKTMKLCVDAKHHMRSYGGTEDYDDMIQSAVPVVPAAQTQQTTTTQAPRTTTTSQTLAPPGAVLVRAPTTTTQPPATVPATTPTPPPGAIQVRPPTTSAAPSASTGLTLSESSLLAALRQQQGIDIARRASDAARRFLGLGADRPEYLYPEAPMSRLPETTPQGPIVAATATPEQLSHWAHQLVYSANPQNSRPASEAQTRALVFQRGAGIPQTGNFDALTREECAKLVGEWVRSLPERNFREMLPTSQAAAASVTAAAAAPPAATSTGLPAAQLPGLVTVTPVPSAGGTPVLVSPAPAAARGDGGTNPIVYGVLGYLTAKALEA